MFVILAAYLLINYLIVAKAVCVFTASTFHFNHHDTDYDGWRCPTECRSEVLAATRKYFSDTFNVQTTITREVTEKMDQATGSCNLATSTCSGGVSVSEKTETEVTVIYRDVTWAASVEGDVEILDCQEGKRCDKCSCGFFPCTSCAICGGAKRHCNGDYTGQVTFTAAALSSCTATPPPTPHPTPLPTSMPSNPPTTYPSIEQTIDVTLEEDLKSSSASKGRVSNLLILGGCLLVATHLLRHLIED